MKKIDVKMLVITGIVCLIPILFGVYYFDELPAQMAVHFGINNEPNNFSSKAFAIFGIPFILFALQIFMCIIADIFDKNKKNNKKINTVTKWIIPLISVAVNLMIIFYSLGKNINIQMAVCILLGIVFIVVGNYIPKSKPNKVIGVRTKYTLNNDEIWKKTSRITGFVMIIFGVLLIIAAFMKGIFAAIIVGAFIVAMLAISFIYPVSLAKKYGIDHNE